MIVLGVALLLAGFLLSLPLLVIAGSLSRIGVVLMVVGRVDCMAVGGRRYYY